MSSDSMVIEDGVDETKPGPRARSGWLLAAVGFGLGLALGTIIASPPETPARVETATEPTTRAGPAEPEPGDDAGISLVIPGFPDALVGVHDGPGSGLDHILWPVAGAPVVRSMTGGSDVRFDARSQHLAMSYEVPGLDGLLLSMGRFNSIRPVVSSVTSYAWHDSDPGELAYTTEKDGEWQLFTVSPSLVPEMVVSGVLEGGTVAAWGGWGFAIQTPEGHVALLTSEGSFKAQEPGVALASHEDGWVLVDDDGLKLVSAGGGVQGLAPSDEQLQRISAAMFSPDGSKVAVAGRFGVVVLDLADTEGGVSLMPRYPSDWVSWSSDSRFVIAPAQSGVLIHDLESGDEYRVLVGRTVVTADVLPLSPS